MNKTIMKRITALLLAAAIVAGIWIAMPDSRDGYAGETVVATPTIQKMSFQQISTSRDADGNRVSGANKSDISSNYTFNGEPINWNDLTDMSQYIPVYSIIQPNGYGANYVKLRDVAALVNFNVQWSFANPNAMYIWTNNHYAEEPKFSGPATETKVGEWSTYDIYVDGVKVEGLQPVLIEDNNYFKIRDIARMVDFGCLYDISSEEVLIRGELRYVEENELSSLGNTVSDWMKNSPKRRFVFQNVRPTYGYPSGTVSATPVTLTENDPWARENYFDKYASQELKDFLGYDPSSNDRDEIELERREVACFNAAVQLILDEEMADDPNYCLPQADPYGVGDTFSVEKISQDGFAVKLQAMDPKFVLPNMDNIRQTVDSLNSDRERISYLVELVCRKTHYAGSGAQYEEMKARLAAVGIDMYDSNDDAIAARKELGGDFYLDWDIQQGTVCEGYAGAINCLCISLGYYVTGVAGTVNGGSHAWNEVWLPDEGKWVGVDATFADDYGLMSNGSIGNEVFLEIIEDEWVCWDVGGPNDSRIDNKNPTRSTLMNESILNTLYTIRPGTYKMDSSRLIPNS